MRKSITVQVLVEAPQQIVFDIFTQHETYRKLPVVKNTVLLQAGEGNESNGLGAVREIKTIAGILREKVIAIDHPNYWDYLFIAWPLPFSHGGGRMQFEPVSKGTLVTWQTSYEIGTNPLWKMTTPTISVFNKVFLKYLGFKMRKIAISDTKAKTH